MESPGRRLDGGFTKYQQLPMNHPFPAVLIGRCRTKVISQLANCQAPAQYPGYKIVQSGSTFNTKFKIGDDSSLDQGNKIHGVPCEGIKQEGSHFGGEIEGVKSAKISQGNEINGQKAEAGDNNGAEG